MTSESTSHPPEQQYDHRHAENAPDSPLARVRISEHVDLCALEGASSSSASSNTAGPPVQDPTPSASASSSDAVKNATDASSTSAVAATTDDVRPQTFFDVRVAVVGNVDSGKSTIIGVLTGGHMDNGRGLARSRVFMHKHESDTGRTSCISQHILGYDAANAPVFNPSVAGASAQVKTKSWTHVVQNSAHVMTFIDLAGHEKYLKTTIAGLTGCFPDYAMVIINGLAGITKMTKEHLGVVLALNIPLICVVTKVDMAPENVLARTKTQLFKVLKSQAAQKMPIQIKSSKDVQSVIDSGSDRVCPVFFVSCVQGTHIALMHEYLARLQPRRSVWMHEELADDGTPLSVAGAGHAGHASHAGAGAGTGATPSEADAALPTGPSSWCEYVIDETFQVTGVGVVVSGTVQRGVMQANSTLLLGPHSDGTFKPVFVRSLHCKRVNVDNVRAGDSCAVSIRAIGRKEHLTRHSIRRGMCLIEPSLNPVATNMFEAEVHILHHPTTIKLGYQAVVHAGMIRQVASIVHIEPIKEAGGGDGALEQSGGGAVPAGELLSQTLSSSTPSSAQPASMLDCLRTGDRARVRLRFLIRPEYLHAGIPFIFREGSTKGIGRVVRVKWTKEERAQLMEQEELENKQRRYAHQKEKMQHASQQAAAQQSLPTASVATASVAAAMSAAVSTLATPGALSAGSTVAAAASGPTTATTTAAVSASAPSGASSARHHAHGHGHGHKGLHHQPISRH